MSAKTFADVGIEIPLGRAGEIDTACPVCSAARKKHTQKCLSVNTTIGTWFCHHCGWAGWLGRGLGDFGKFSPKRSPVTPKPVYAVPKCLPATSLPPSVARWFSGRGIPPAILQAAGIRYGQAFCPQERMMVGAIQFPYVRQGQIINIKYRGPGKTFWMVKGAQRILYGLDDIAGAKTICIVEGEIDKLSIDTVAGPPTMSVPDGAPPADASAYATKFSFLDESVMAHLNAATTVLVGTDMDPPGIKLADELARRIGWEKCSRIFWLEGCKDANDVLVRHGPAAVRDAIANAEPYAPVREAVRGTSLLTARSAPLRIRSPRIRLRGVRHA